MITLIFKLLTVALAHVGVSVWLYRSRIQHTSLIFNSDFLVFGLPALVALCAYTYFIQQEVISRLSINRPTTVSASLALILTVLSSWIVLYVAFNRYGT
jgi:hypothetical protein